MSQVVTCAHTRAHTHTHTLILKDKACEAMELFDELVECDIGIVVPYLSSLIQFCLEIATNTHLGNNIRVKALSFVSWLITLKKKAGQPPSPSLPLSPSLSPSLSLPISLPLPLSLPLSLSPSLSLPISLPLPSEVSINQDGGGFPSLPPGSPATWPPTIHPPDDAGHHGHSR